MKRLGLSRREGISVSIKYVADIYIDLGEDVHIRSKVHPVCEDETATFIIESAKYELYHVDSMSGDVELEANDDLSIEDDHILDALINPQKTGTYRLKYIYTIADETWVDVMKLRVN